MHCLHCRSTTVLTSPLSFWPAWTSQPTPIGMLSRRRGHTSSSVAHVVSRLVSLLASYGVTFARA